MERYLRSRLLASGIAIVAVSSHLLFGSQVQPGPASKDKSLNAHASCYDVATGKLVGSHTSRTSVLVSPDGSFRAYAESDAVASGLANRPECSNTSRLFVAGRDSRKFQTVLSVEPSPKSLGNGIDLVDWSPKGHRLLLAQGTWQYGSDVGGTRVRIYDADSDSLSSESLMDEVFSRYVGKTCSATFQPLGFSGNGSAVVRAEPYFDYGEHKAVEDSCVQKKSFWLVDFAIPTVRQLADSYEPRHYGKVTL
jgi:hypothetical protein